MPLSINRMLFILMISTSKNHLASHDLLSSNYNILQFDKSLSQPDNNIYKSLARIHCNFMEINCILLILTGIIYHNLTKKKMNDYSLLSSGC